ncbi:MAG: CoA transferase [Dehalococcoidia bacterium]
MTQSIPDVGSVGLLAGARVVNLSSQVPGVAAGSLLGGLGAAVELMCPPGGHPLAANREFAWRSISRAQRLVVADLTDLDRLARHCRGVTLVIEDEPAKDPRGIRAALFGLSPAPSVLSLTPLGLTGPERGVPVSDLTALARSGLLASCGLPGREPLLPAPVVLDAMVTAAVFAGAVGAITWHEASGCPHRVDLGKLDVFVNSHENAVSRYSYAGAVHRREGNQLHSQAPWDLYACRDGQVGVIVLPRSWDVFCMMLNRLDLQKDPRFAEPADRAANRDELDKIIRDWLSTRGRKEVFHEGQSLHMPFGAVEAAGETLRSDHLVARGFGEPVAETPAIAPGFPAVIDGVRPRLGTPTSSAPSGAIPASSLSGDPLPLSGVRILDLGIAWAGAFCSRLLADLGAEVIKIESRKRLDLRGQARPRPGTGAYLDGDPGSDPWNRAGIFHERHRDKLSVTIELDRPGGRDAFLKLVEQADAVIENFSARVMEQFNLGHAVLRSVRPQLVAMSMGGFGRSGPWRDYVAFGDTLEQLSGSTAAGGYPGGPPMNSGLHFPDPAVGTFAAGVVMAAIRRARMTGEGASIDIAQLEAVSWLVGELALQHGETAPVPRLGNRDAQSAPQGVYPAAGDDEWIALTVDSDAAWEALCGLADGPLDAFRNLDLPGRYAAHDAIDRAISTWTVEHEGAGLAAEARQRGVAAALAAPAERLALDPQVIARKLLLDHPTVSGDRRVLGRMFMLDGTRPPLRRPAPRLGEHNRQVLRDVGGLNDNEIDQLEAVGTIGAVPAELSE